MSTVSNSSYNPTNNSVSKQQFSFPRSERFKQSTKVNCQQICYDIPDTLIKRNINFGIGKRCDFVDPNKKLMPSCQQYNVKSLFEENSVHKRGVSMGCGREKMKFCNTFETPSKDTPAPNQYNIKRNLSERNILIKSRTQNSLELTTQRHTPGPGSYPVVSCISKDGKYPIAKYSGSKASIWAPPSLQRFQKENSSNLKVPGPIYNPKNNLSVGGQYVLSTWKNCNGMTFVKQGRKDIKLDQKPGPGTYALPSDFGTYIPFKKR